MATLCVQNLVIHGWQTRHIGFDGCWGIHLLEGLLHYIPDHLEAPCRSGFGKRRLDLALQPSMSVLYHLVELRAESGDPAVKCWVNVLFAHELLCLTPHVNVGVVIDEAWMHLLSYHNVPCIAQKFHKFLSCW